MAQDIDIRPDVNIDTNMAKDVNIWQNIVEVDDRHWQLAKDSFMAPPLGFSQIFFLLSELRSIFTHSWPDAKYFADNRDTSKGINNKTLGWDVRWYWYFYILTVKDAKIWWLAAKDVEEDNHILVNVHCIALYFAILPSFIYFHSAFLITFPDIVG